jgi:hypothetical protein
VEDPTVALLAVKPQVINQSGTRLELSDLRRQELRQPPASLALNAYEHPVAGGLR